MNEPIRRVLDVDLPAPHPKQAAFLDSPAHRVVVRSGRRSGKTVGTAILAVEEFLAGRRVLYAAPTSDQLDRFWTETTRALAPLVDENVIYQNETKHILEFPGTETRIRAKTAWNADTLRGDWADLLILDEYQMMAESAWGEVGAPMLADRNGRAIFIYTPPSLQNRAKSRAHDPQHAAKLYRRAAADTTGRYAAFSFTSRDNPHISALAIDELAADMTALAYRMEILAEDVDQSPSALWTRDTLEQTRLIALPRDLARVVVAVDPSATATGDEAGIITAAATRSDFYAFADDSLQGSPLAWATAAVTAFHVHDADAIVAESNQGGEMVATTIHAVDPSVPVVLVHASRGKHTRAEPVAALFEKGRAHLVGTFPKLEDELCLWTPGDPSPNRLDALVHAATELLHLTPRSSAPVRSGPMPLDGYRG